MMNRDQSPHRTWLIKFLLLVSTLGFSPSCGHVDVAEDFAMTQEMIRSKTGASSFRSDDAAADEINEMIVGLLSGGLSKDDAVSIALMNNAGFRARLANIGIARADLVAAGIPQNPMLSGSVRVPTGPGVLDVSGTIMQVLTDLILIPSRQRVANTRLESTRLEVARQAVLLAAKVRQGWISVVTSRQTLGVIDEELKLFTSALALTRDRVTAGLADVLDVNLAQAAVREVGRAKIIARAKYESAVLTLGRDLGLSRWTEDWSVAGNLDERRLSLDTDDLIRRATDNRLIIEIAKLNARAGDEDLERAAGTKFPKFSLGFTAERPEAPPSLLGPSISLELPLFGNSEPKIARARFLAVQARKNLINTLNRVAAEVRAAILEVETSQQILRLYDSQLLPAAHKNVKAAIRSYQAGTRSVLILIQAEKSLIRYKKKQVLARGRLAKGLSTLSQAIGGPIVAPAKNEESK